MRYRITPTQEKKPCASVPAVGNATRLSAKITRLERPDARAALQLSRPGRPPRSRMRRPCRYEPVERPRLKTLPRSPVPCAVFAAILALLLAGCASSAPSATVLGAGRVTVTTRTRKPPPAIPSEREADEPGRRSRATRELEADEERTQRREEAQEAVEEAKVQREEDAGR